MSERVVVFGAGATGRGHVGLLAWQAGAELVFVERRRDLVSALQRAGCYTVRLYGAGDRYQDVSVHDYRILSADQRPTVAEEVAGAGAVLTAVFDQNLPDVAQTLALATSVARAGGRNTPLNVIACENMMDSSSALGHHVRSLLTGHELAYHDDTFAYPDCMISRVVPIPADPLYIVAEDYNEWTARREAFRGPKPAALASLELVDNQTARLERKLFIHNGGHAICGYFGYLRGHRYIHEAVADPVVARHVMGALDQIGEAVRLAHGFSAASIHAYKADLVRRGSVAEMRDEISRVVRDPLRKLSPRERLVGPALLAGRFNLPRDWIVLGIVAALRCCNPADPQSVRLAEQLARAGLPAVLQSICQIEADSSLAVEILAAWDNWSL